MSENTSIQVVPIIITCVCIFLFLEILFLLRWYCKKNRPEPSSENRISIEYTNNPLEPNKFTITTSQENTHTSIQIHPLTHSPTQLPISPKSNKQNKIFIIEEEQIQMTPIKVNRLNKK